MTVLGDARGTFKAIDLDVRKGQGVVVQIPGAGNPVGSASLVTSFSVSQAENYSVAQCLNGGVHMYTFGHDPQRSAFTLGVTSFLNPCSGGVAEDLATAVQAYRAGRVSQSGQQASLSVGKASFGGYLVAQQIDVVDAQLGIVTTTYGFVALNAH